MDIDRAIHIVRNRACTECDSSNSDWDCSECDEALTLAVKGLELLKEQHPRTVKNVHYFGDVALGDCPSCGDRVVKASCPNFCGKCGDRIDWKDGEQE